LIPGFDFPAKHREHHQVRAHAPSLYLRRRGLPGVDVIKLLGFVADVPVPMWENFLRP